MMREVVIDPRNIEVMDDDMAQIFRAMTGAQRLKIAAEGLEVSVRARPLPSVRRRP